ncbi:MATE family efflux transporter [Vibrio mediterranei]
MQQQTFSEFIKRVLVLGVPIALQSLLMSSLGFVDSLMISQLGTQEVAAAGIGARIFWVSIVFIWGLSSGMGILLAQYWGAQDEHGLKNNLALGTIVTQIFAFLCFSICFFTPQLLPQLFNPSREVLTLSSQYIQLLGIATLLSGLAIAADTALRSIGQTHINLYLSIMEIGLNVTLNYVLIFGHFGAPELGLLGAGIGSVIARSIRLIAVITIIYYRYPVLAIRLEHISNAFKPVLVGKFFAITYPIVVGTFIWCAGIFTFHLILGRMGETELATMAVITPLESIGLSVAHGLSSAVGIMIGNSLGANQFGLSTIYACWAFKSAILLGAVLGALLLIMQTAILQLYGALSLDVIDLMTLSFPVVALSILMRSINITLIVGILRSGGDNKFCMNMDFVCQWVWAVPLTALGAIFFDWSFPVVLLMMTSEEIVKAFPATWRVFSHRWVNNLTDSEARPTA